MAKTKIGRKIAVARAAKDLTLDQVSAETGLTTQTINRIEQGHTENPSVRSLYLLSECLGLDIDDLLDALGVPADGSGAVA